MFIFMSFIKARYVRQVSWIKDKNNDRYKRLFFGVEQVSIVYISIFIDQGHIVSFRELWIEKETLNAVVDVVIAKYLTPHTTGCISSTGNLWCIFRNKKEL